MEQDDKDGEGSPAARGQLNVQATALPSRLGVAAGRDSTDQPLPDLSASQTGPRNTIPLREQVKECAKQWFKEAIELAAEENDGQQMGLCGLMLLQGWGCERNPQLAERWLYAAACRGVPMPPSYKLPAIPPPPPPEIAHLPVPTATELRFEDD